MSTREEIIDYKKNKEEIEKWISLKGEQKYHRFVDLLKNNAEPITWKVLSDTYKYDKRLLFNVFKYLSFFEEFLRAQLWNIGDTMYETLEQDYLYKVMEAVINNKESIRFSGFSIEDLEHNKNKVNLLRRRVAHNKIILEGEQEFSVVELLSSFYETLPTSYQHGFKEDINKCKERLKLPQSLIVIL